MKCPSCSGDLLQATPQCPHCQLTLRKLDSKFGAVPRHSTWLTDQAGLLAERDLKELRLLLRLFHGKFPQSLFSVFLTNEPPGPIWEYTFWMANRGRFGNVEAGGADNFDLLLGIDVAGRASSLVIGYGLECFLSERDLAHALTQAVPAFQLGHFADGIRACVASVTERMKSVAKSPGGSESEKAAIVNPS